MIALDQIDSTVTTSVSDRASGFGTRCVGWRRPRQLPERDRVSHFVEHQLDGRQRGDDVQFVDHAEVGHAENLALQCPWPPASLTPKRLSSRSRNAGPSIAAGKRTAVIPSAGRAANSSSPAPACRPRMARRLSTPRSPKRLRCPRRGSLASDSARPAISVLAGVQGVSGRRCAVQLVAVQFQIEVKRLRLDALHLLPGRFADGQKCQARRHHQRLLRADDQHVDAPGIGQARHRAGAADGVDHPQRVARGHDLADRLDVVAHAGAAFHQRAEHGHGVGMFGQQSRHVGRLDGLAPGRPRAARPRCRSGGRCRPSAARTRPTSSTIALPPRGTRFTTAASIAPVPELASTTTSFSV